MVNTTASAPSVRIGPTRWTEVLMPETAWWLKNCWYQQKIRYVLRLCHQVLVLHISRGWQPAALSCAHRDYRYSLSIEKGEESCWEKEIVGLPHCGLDPARDRVMESQTKRVFKGPVTFLRTGLSIEVNGSICELSVMCILRVLW